VIDQTLLPNALEWLDLVSLEDFCRAIADMQVRGAPLIGITAAFGLALDIQRAPDLESLERSTQQLLATRPTAVNLQWALERVRRAAAAVPEGRRGSRAWAEAVAIAEADVAACRAIGEHGLALLRELPPVRRGDTLQVLTHCNAGFLATLEWGTALAPLYLAREQGIPVHVWVSETRPRNQGASLTAWELARAGIPHTVIADNAAGHLMQSGRVDCCIVGSDRTAANGDVCNKIGTYLKALSAQANGIPFYVALPLSTIDWDCPSGAAIPVEERDAEEVLSATGRTGDGASGRIWLANAGSPAWNPAFDITPAALVSALITERGVSSADPEALEELRPCHRE
jgi:methylthioribose-1-phosphate isomerase